MITGSPETVPKTGILNSIVFHKIPTVEFDFAAAWGAVGANFYFYTLLDRVSAKEKMIIEDISTRRPLEADQISYSFDYTLEYKTYIFYCSSSL